MQPFVTLTAVAAPLPMINVDTDMIIPKDYLKTIGRTGLGRGLFAEISRTADGAPDPDFPLNQPQYAAAEILIAGDNFGCGSSREHAPWALLDRGIRCVISTSFADIFYQNCFKNGLLPVVVTPQELERLMAHASRGANATLTVDLPAQTVSGADGDPIPFSIDPGLKAMLVGGLDEIALTLHKREAIAAHEARFGELRPWV
ncbi:3-isopropylmalate dehydratase small subunit [Acuticoccus sp.]|uniref:3-isopropylmalate dehydratase small subunit n=1 Tax=Acuticoccus sp. TaxID=1904378 RepID=UPI003B52BFF0